MTNPATGPTSNDPFLDGFLLGLERGNANAYDAGYADAEQVLHEVITEFTQANPPRQIIANLEARAARERARLKPVDPRTPAQVQHDAYLSWGLEPPEELQDQDADEADVEATDDLDAGW